MNAATPNDTATDTSDLTATPGHSYEPAQNRSSRPYNEPNPSGHSSHETPANPITRLPDEVAANPLSRLSDEQLEQIAAEFDAIRDKVMSDLGDRDRRYIESVIALHRRLAVLGRLLLLASRRRPAWLAGTGALSAAKVLENMEIGHNVMHGQWDWMNDPRIHSTTWDWDNVSPAGAWKHSHNYEHHTFTNIRGKDRDLGYEIMRIDPEQKWHPVYLLQPLYNLVLAAFFEWGVALHDLNFEAIRSGEKPRWKVADELRAIGVKVREQARKDYLAWPLLSALAMAALAGASTVREQRRQHQPAQKGRRGLDIRRSLRDVLRETRLRSGAGHSERRGRWLAPVLREALRAEPLQSGSGQRHKRGRGLEPLLRAALNEGLEGFRLTLTADATANIVRNVWAYAIIFCGHFPDGTYSFSEEEVEGETPGGWYVRQLLGSANIDGGPLFHLASGNLGYQVEHHLFPDMPSTRYSEVAPLVREVCARHGLPYNSGRLSRQLGTVQRTILRLAFPGRRRRGQRGPRF